MNHKLLSRPDRASEVAHSTSQPWDLVLIQDSNLVRGQWRLGIVSNTFPGSDVKVRKVEVQYKNPKQGEPVTKYQGRGYVTIERPVHRLVLLTPKDDISDLNSVLLLLL